MRKNLYKYIGPEVLTHIFNKDGHVGFKCSYPKNYNDPYELFLSIDRNLRPELLSFYQDIVGEIPQFPTTCFSNSPTVVPMWAHYAHTAKGFVIEINGDMIEDFISDSDIVIEDVTYSNEPNEDLAEFLGRAYMTCKPRHTYHLHQVVMHSAYFYKQKFWSYEEEKRVVVQDSELIESVDGHMIFYLPIDCVQSIIAGENISDEKKEEAIDICNSNNIELYRANIGKSFPDKYMTNHSGLAHIFDGHRIVIATNNCEKCGEPIKDLNNNIKTCSWCSITEIHMENAAQNNPYRVLDAVGLLERQIRAYQDITNRKR